MINSNHSTDVKGNLELIPNPPNAGKLIKALRHLDYDNLTALADIVDNSIDAGASQVFVDILTDKTLRETTGSEVAQIIISDNGSGMSRETLDEAMKLGSNAERNASFDLGLYGMGLVTASISIGTRLEVITETKEGGCLVSIQDLNVIEASNEFIKELRPAIEDEPYTLHKHLYSRLKKGSENKGTVVTIDGVDNCQWKRESGLTENLISHFGQVYRKFIKAGKIKITVQGKAVVAIDPIYDFNPEILVKEEITVDGETVYLTITEIEDYGQQLNKEKGINVKNQGFYILRNNREIRAGETLGVFTKHNDLNELRIEFSYPGTLDDALSANFSKNRIQLDQRLRDKVQRIVTPYIKQIKGHSKDRQKSKRVNKEDFSEIEKFITQKAHLLDTPKSEVEDRSPRKKTNSRNKIMTKDGSPRLNIVKRKRNYLDALKVKFELRDLTERGALYNVDMEKDTVIIEWNEAHPFYLEFVAPNNAKPDIQNPICFLVYCLASAELRCLHDSEDIAANIRIEVGKNMATLMR